MSAAALLLVVAVIVGADLWVFADAQRQARHGAPVVFRAASLSIETPAAWAVACLVLFVIFLPIYAAARRS